MTADGHKKFLFDTDFSPDASLKAQMEEQLQAEIEAELAEKTAQEVETLEEILPTFSEDDLERAREEGYQNGHTEASRDLTAALEQRLTNAMEAINTQIADLFDAFAKDKEEHSRDAVAVATVIVRKLFPALNMDKAMAEIEHMIIEAMQRTSGSPTLVVRVPPDVRDVVEDKANELAALRGREGTITVMADDTLGEGDSAVEWDGGGMIRDSALMWQEIDEIIERNLGTNRASGFIPAEQPAPTQDAAVDPGPLPSEEPDGTETQDDTQEVVNAAPVGENTEPTAESAQEHQQGQLGDAPNDEEQGDAEQQASSEMPAETAHEDEAVAPEDESADEETPDTPDNES